MGTLLDAYAIVAFLLAEPAAGKVERIIRQGDSALTSVNLAECIDVLTRRQKVSEMVLREAISELLAGGVDLVVPGQAEAWRTGLLRARYYGRQRRISLADCFLLGAAGKGDRVATADRVVAEVAQAEGIEVLLL